MRYTTAPTTTRVYLAVSDHCQDGADYEFRIDPVGAIVSRGAPFWPANATAEPNDRPALAAGPLRGGTPYQGTINSLNDVDWLYFYAKPGRALDVAITALNGDSRSSGMSYTLGPQLEVIMATTLRASASSTVSDHLRFTTGSSLRRYYIKATPGGGGGYLLRIDPADALSILPECERAAGNRRTRRTTVSRLRKQFGKAKTRSVKRTKQRALRVARARLRATERRVQMLCG
jgi:hypothetical protein